MKLRRTFGRRDIVGQPAAVTAFAHTAVVVDTVSPGAEIEILALGKFRLPLVGMVDIGVNNVARHTAIEDQELRIVVIATERRRLQGVEFGVGHNEFVVYISASVMPENGACVADKTAAGGIAGATRTDEIHSGTAQIEI